jgi:transposase
MNLTKALNIMALLELFGQGRVSMKSLRSYLGGPPPRVSYDPSQVGRLLKKVGWTRQKPQPKARQ